MRQRGYVQLILIGIVAAAVAGGLLWTYETGHDAGYIEAMAEIEEIARQREVKEDVASVSLEKDRERVRTVYRTITQEVDRVIEKKVVEYRDVCLDDDGLRLANAALTGALVPAGEPDRRMPAAEPARERDAGGGATQADGSR
jgi:hypothetical protein